MNQLAEDDGLRETIGRPRTRCGRWTSAWRGKSEAVWHVYQRAQAARPAAILAR